MNPDQIVPMGAVLSGSIVFAIQATKVHKQMEEQMIIVLKDIIW